MVKYTVRCYARVEDRYAPITALNATQRRELSDRIVGNMCAAMQERVNRVPAEFNGTVGK